MYKVYTSETDFVILGALTEVRSLCELTDEQVHKVFVRGHLLVRGGEFYVIKF